MRRSSLHSLAFVLLCACGDDLPSVATTTTTATQADGTSPSTTAPDPTAADSTGPAPDMGGPPPACTVDPSPAAMTWPGPQDDGSVVLVNGRRTSNYGASRLLQGHGFDVALHPTAPVAYVTTAGRDERRLYVVDRNTEEIVQDIDRGHAYYGMLIAPDGSRLYASNGVPGGVDVLDVAADGMVTPAGELPVAGWTAGMAGSPDGATLWVASFDANRITEVDTATLAVTRLLQPGLGTWDVLHVPSRDELWASAFGEGSVRVIDLPTGSLVATIDLPTRPSMMVLSEDESRCTWR